LNILLYIIASLFVISSFSLFTGSPQKVGPTEKLFINASAFIGGILSIIFVSWFIVLLTVFTMWIIYWIGLSKIDKSDIILNSSGDKIFHNGKVLRIDALALKIYDLMQNFDQNKLTDFKNFLNNSTESTDLKDSPLKVYPSVYPDKAKNYVINTNNSFGFIEIYEKSSSLLHAGFQLLLPLEVKKNQLIQMRLLKSVFSVIKPKYGNPFAQDEGIMVFKDDKSICIVLHDERQIDSANKALVLTVRVFNRQFWDPDKVQVQSLMN
jgi:hypothetical protein